MQKIGTFLNNREYEILKEICEKEGKTHLQKNQRNNPRIPKQIRKVKS
jgi:hypothetical protein